MSLNCESVARLILPIYRSFVAKELIQKYRLTQNDAAKKLGTTQAAISQYVNSKRGVKSIPNYAKIEPIIKDAAGVVAKRLVNDGLSPDEFSVSFCELCKEIRQNKMCH